jgi:hypothetical protein
LFLGEFRPFLKENSLFLEEVALLPKELEPFPRENTLPPRKLPFSSRNLGPSLGKIHCSPKNFYSSLCKLFFKIFHLFLREFFCSMGNLLNFLKQLAWE